MLLTRSGAVSRQHSPTASLPPPLPAARQPRRRHELDGGSGRWACRPNADDKQGDACFWSEGGVNTSEPSIYHGTRRRSQRAVCVRCVGDGAPSEGSGL